MKFRLGSFFAFLSHLCLMLWYCWILFCYSFILWSTDLLWNHQVATEICYHPSTAVCHSQPAIDLGLPVRFVSFGDSLMGFWMWSTDLLRHHRATAAICCHPSTTFCIIQPAIYPMLPVLLWWRGLLLEGEHWSKWPLYYLLRSNYTPSGWIISSILIIYTLD